MPMSRLFMERFIQHLKKLDVFFFFTKLNKQKSLFIAFDHRKSTTVEELFDVISFYNMDYHYRGINSPLDIINIKKYGTDQPTRTYAHFAIESYRKCLEYGKSEVGQVICAYARNDLTNVIISEEGNSPSETHPHTVVYDNENYFSAIPQSDFHSGYDLVYGRAIKNPKTIAPKVVVYLAENDEQSKWFQSAIHVAKISVA
tara:strand:+ start:546 stop:1148 length:603 start_codon:yes stop_codon:yes gene_type:complete